MIDRIRKFSFYNKMVLPYHLVQAVVAGIRYKFPARKLKVIGVTGTNGKTTTCFYIWKMLNEAEKKTGLMTTVAWGVDELEPELNHMTTVDSMTLNKRIMEIKKKGAEYLVLEATSHAMEQFRTLGVSVEVAVFTNLTREHLDYHGTMEKYRDAKRKLFKKAKFGVINADDEVAEYFEKDVPKYITYGIFGGEKRAKVVKNDEFGIKYSSGDMTIESDLVGKFNVYNSLAAVCVGEYLGLNREQIEKGIGALKSVDGRMNRIDEGQNFSVIVDYAHTPDALEKVFGAISGVKGKIIAVHGGAGRRDGATREPRGEILGKNCDIVIITEDDSRDEDPEKIADEFLRGAEKVGKIRGEDLFVELDRRKAIELACRKARANDVVLILGKGHEKTILRKNGAVKFADVDVAREVLKSMI